LSGGARCSTWTSSRVLPSSVRCAFTWPIAAGTSGVASRELLAPPPHPAASATAAARAQLEILTGFMHGRPCNRSAATRALCSRSLERPARREEHARQDVGCEVHREALLLGREAVRERHHAEAAAHREPEARDEL